MGEEMKTEFKNLKYVSCHVDKNEDGTFCVFNIFEDDNGRVVEQKYPRVSINSQPDIYNIISPFPIISHVEILASRDNEELFTIEIKE